MKENVRVVVLGKNHSTPLGVIRSLGVNGYTLDVFYVAKTENESHVLKGSKYVSKVMEIVGRYDEDIVNMLMKEYESATETLVLFPTDDYTSSLIDRNRDVLSTRFLMPYIVGNKQGAITHFMDKSVQSALAHQFDLPTAPEWLISLDGEIVIPEELPYPCF
ncbi:MAG: hypothetical protein HUJ58_08175, partial [Erysipelotrichaceae bacterium]|nr:hypothetical protein [Erysipelotrichaceae bacterium]